MAANTKSLPSMADGSEVVGTSFGASSNPTANCSRIIVMERRRSSSMSYSATSVMRGEPPSRSRA